MSAWQRVAIMAFACVMLFSSSYELGRRSVEDPCEQKMWDLRIKHSDDFGNFAKRMRQAYDDRDKEEIEKAIKENEAQREQLQKERPKK